MNRAVIGNPSHAALVTAGLLAPDSAYAVRRELGLVFGVADGHELRLDQYCPVGAAGPRPGVVLVHGGGWSGGERGQFGWHAEQLASYGYVAITIDYRLTDVAPFPACAQDCQRAVRWLRSRAAELHLDPERLGAYGSSAGGHLVALLGTRDTLADDAPELAGLSSRVQCVVDFHGVHDFRALPAGGLADDCCAALLGRDRRRRAWREASPRYYVDGRSAPTLLFHDPHDTVVPYAQSVEFAAALMAAGRPVQFEPVPGAGHGFCYDPRNAWQQRTWPLALAWLNRFLRP